MDDVWLQSRIRENYERLRRQLGTGKVAEKVVAAVVESTAGVRETKSVAGDGE
jgi:hypothetical protein